jgi:hypothetical protein
MTASKARSRGKPVGGVHLAEAGSEGSRAVRAIEFALVAGVIVIFGLLVYRFVTHAGVLLAYPFEWDEDEGLAIYFARQLLRHQPIYVDINHLPMLTACYPPIYHLAIAPFVAALGPSLLAGRIVSLLATAAIAAAAVLAVRLEGARWRWGALAAALMLASPAVTTWCPLARVDSLALALAAWGLLLVRQSRWPRAGAALGMALLLLATFTRYQSILLVPAALWALWRQDRRTAVIAGAGWALAVAGVLAGMNAWTGGRFWMSTFTIQATDYSYSLLLERVGVFASRHFVLIAGMIAWAVYRLVRREIDLWTALAFSAIPLELLLGKVGASINYHLPVVLIGSVCTVLCARALVGRGVKSRGLAACGWLALLAVQGLVFYVEPIRAPSSQDREANEALLSRIRGVAGPVLTERRIMLSVLTDRQPQADSCTLFFVYAQRMQIWPNGGLQVAADRPMVWDPTELVQAARDRKYPLIILDEWTCIPSEVLAAVFDGYKRLRTELTIGNWHGQNRYFLLVPRE